MIDRWSYDPRTKILDVWDSEDNRIQHLDRWGYVGYQFCSQGRFLDGGVVSIYGNRPMEKELSGFDPDVVRYEAKVKIKEYLGDLAPDPVWLEVF